MNAITRLNVLISVLLALLATTPRAFAMGGEGGKEGHGGDAYSQDFFFAAMKGLDALRLKFGQTPGQSAIEAELHEVRVTSEESLSLHGIDVAWIDYPDQNILVISRGAWDKLASQDERMEFALERIRSLARERSGTDPLGNELKAALDDAKRERQALRQKGMEVLSAYIDLGRRALTFNRDEYLHDLEPVSESKDYRKCYGYHIFITEGDKRACAELTGKIRALPPFQRVRAGLSGKEERDLTEYLKSLPHDSPEIAAFEGWSGRILSSFEDNRPPVVRIFEGIGILNDNCYSPALLQPPTPECFMEAFRQMISGNQAQAIERARLNYEADAKAVSDEMQSFLKGADE